MNQVNYSTLCYILGKIEGISWGVKEEKIKTALVEVSESLSELLNSIKVDMDNENY